MYIRGFVAVVCKRVNVAYMYVKVFDRKIAAKIAFTRVFHMQNGFILCITKYFNARILCHKQINQYYWLFQSKCN